MAKTTNYPNNISHFELWKEIIINPTKTFEKISRKTKYKNALFFALKVQAISLLALYAFFMVALPFNLIPLAINDSFAATVSGISMIFILFFMLIALPFLLVLSALGLFINTLIIHLFVKLVGGKRPYNETFKAISYSMAPTIFAFIPFVNWAASIYMIVLQVIGISKRQKLSIGKTILALILPIILIFIGIFLLLFIIASIIILTGGFY
ncbi:hypothetical protein HN385_06805 [archaeon]|jgi:hypothetical protein|nr:hypothetical protein [archaeon]MBT3450324.1 hypothetical protein [archaeon]MBT6869186.1 hypothetical protein [archaeon]MBT7193722.1 hypothetical protein [archaeon]MBT7381369.1 hypothetical protein [archaeon]